MKSKTLRLLSLAGLSALALGLTSCGGKTLTAVAYQLDRGIQANEVDTDENSYRAKSYTAGDYVFRSQVVVNRGTIAEVHFQEAYTYATWARVSAEAALANPADVIAVPEVYVDANNKGTLYYAKHIAIGDYFFTGMLRKVETDAQLFSRGMYIEYRWDRIATDHPNVKDSSLLPYDLDDYLAVAGSDTYKLGVRLRWYYEALESNQVKLYGEKDGAVDTTKTYPLNLPDNSYLRSADPNSEAWNSATAALSRYFVGKKLSFSPSYTNEADHDTYSPLRAKDGLWQYHPLMSKGDFSEEGWETIEGCGSTVINRTSIFAYFSAVNNAFGSVEYQSYK